MRNTQDAGLTRLKLLNLSSNTINEIGLSAFVGLLDLRVLDLSRNHLYYILPDTFVGNSKLEVLELAGNTLNQNVPRLRSSSIAVRQCEAYWAFVLGDTFFWRNSGRSNRAVDDNHGAERTSWKIVEFPVLLFWIVKFRHTLDLHCSVIFFLDSHFNVHHFHETKSWLAARHSYV